jgi:hypothetical protein
MRYALRTPYLLCIDRLFLGAHHLQVARTSPVVASFLLVSLLLLSPVRARVIVCT